MCLQLNGTKLGNLLKLEQRPEESEEEVILDKDGELDYKT